MIQVALHNRPAHFSPSAVLSPLGERPVDRFHWAREFPDGLARMNEQAVASDLGGAKGCLALLHHFSFLIMDALAAQRSMLSASGVAPTALFCVPGAEAAPP